LRLAYFGSADFALPALQRLAPHVVLVVSQPDRPQGRGKKLQPTPISAWAREAGLPVQTPEKARDPGFIQGIRDLNLDALVVAAYGQILKPSLLESASKGGINLHGSLLPAWRGAAPIQRAVEAGDSVTGVTLMQMDEGMDTGCMIAKVTAAIAPHETAGELTARLALAAADLAEAWMPSIVAGGCPCEAQDGSLATLARKVGKEDARMDLFLPGEVLYRRFRAFTPAPGAWIPLADGPLKIRRARHLSMGGEPGAILAAQPELTVACGEGSLILLEVQPPGKGAMSGSDWARGRRLEPGARLIGHPA
jgi:methionyl-tRNA formyltransferase